MKNTKKIVLAATLSLVIAATSAFTPFKNGKVIMIVTLEVKSYTDWKKGFDAGAPVREKAGIKVLSVCSSVENENQVVVIEEAESAQAAHDFLALLKSKQKELDLSKLDVKLYDKSE
ncbi:MAG: hypothetical protein V4511_02325 [Bacteroidota bacterium]